MIFLQHLSSPPFHSLKNYLVLLKKIIKILILFQVKLGDRLDQGFPTCGMRTTGGT